jgi:hypothetical protein
MVWICIGRLRSRFPRKIDVERDDMWGFAKDSTRQADRQVVDAEIHRCVAHNSGIEQEAGRRTAVVWQAYDAPRAGKGE